MDNELIIKAIQIAKENPDNFSISLLQRKLKIGHITGAKLLEVLEGRRIIGSYSPKENLRKVLVEYIH